MSEINLDEARQARLEQADERSFTFRGERFVLPAELPYEVLGPLGALAGNEMDLVALRACLVALLGSEEHDRFEALRPSLADVNELVGKLVVDYGIGGAGDEEGAKHGNPLPATSSTP